MNQSAMIFLLKWDAAQTGGCFVPQQKVPAMVFDVFTIDLDFEARRRFFWLNCLGFGHFL